MMMQRKIDSDDRGAATGRPTRGISRTARSRVRAGVAVSLAVVALAAPATAAVPREVTATYSGVDRNWFNPANWSTGQIPGRNTNVVLDGLDDVVIDRALAPRNTRKVHFQDLTLTDSARLTTQPGTIIHTRNERIGRFASVIYRSTESTGDSLNASDCAGCTLAFNPTPNSQRLTILTSTWFTLSPITVQFGLGGTAPAAPGRVGAGHYATLTSERAELGGRLTVATHYGFTPRPGDTFQIITADNLSGRFDNVAEGDRVADFGGVGLYITYRGGDGNDVVLTAR